MCIIQGRSQEFATGGQDRESGGPKSPSGVQGHSPGEGLGAKPPEAGDKCYFPGTTGDMHPCPPLATPLVSLFTVLYC